MEKQLNILFLCSWYPNPDAKSHGIFIRQHAKALALKHKVTVLFVKSVNVREETYTKTQTENLTEITFFYPKAKFNLPIIGDFLKFLKFKRLYQKQINLLDNTFDIIHLNTIFPAAIPTLHALKKSPNAKFFITEHWTGYYPEDGNYKGFITKYYSRKIVAKANGICVISDRLKQSMELHNLNGKFHFINNVIETNVFKPVSETKHQGEVLQILHISTIAERQKNITGIITIAENLKNRNVPFNLIMVGQNDDEIEQHKARAQKNLNKNEIEFVGYKNSVEIAELMNNADVFLLFSNFEGMPVVLLEAMACGLPVITTNVGQVKQMVLNKFGTVLKDNSIEECTQLLKNYNRNDFENPVLMHQVIKKEYGFEAVANSITKIYLEELSV